MTHTYAVLEISRDAWEEIAAKLQAAGYQHAFHRDVTDGGAPVIDMHGIAVKAQRDPKHTVVENEKP